MEQGVFSTWFIWLSFCGAGQKHGCGSSLAQGRPRPRVWSRGRGRLFGDGWKDVSLCHVDTLGLMFFCLFICPFYVTHFLDIEQIAGKQLLKGPFLCKIHFPSVSNLSTSPPGPKMRGIEYCFLCLLLHFSEVLCLENPDLGKIALSDVTKGPDTSLIPLQGRDSTESHVFLH